MSMAALKDWTDFEPLGEAELADISSRVARLEEKVEHIKEGNERQEIVLDHLSAKFDFHREEINKSLGELKESIAVRNATAAERSRNIAVAGGFLGAAAMAIGGFIWANFKAVMAFLATVFR